VEAQRVASVPMTQATQSFAKRPLGQLSPRDTARATIAGSEVWIDYSRPTRRGRNIFGALEPWGQVWRTGANAATQLNTPVDPRDRRRDRPRRQIHPVEAAFAKPAGKLIINNRTGSGAPNIHPSKDLVRIDAKSRDAGPRRSSNS